MGSLNVKSKIIMSQAKQECLEGATTRLYHPDRMMKAHERPTARTVDDIV